METKQPQQADTKSKASKPTSFAKEAKAAAKSGGRASVSTDTPSSANRSTAKDAKASAMKRSRTKSLDMLDMQDHEMSSSSLDQSKFNTDESIQTPNTPDGLSFATVPALGATCERINQDKTKLAQSRRYRPRPRTNSNGMTNSDKSRSKSLEFLKDGHHMPGTTYTSDTSGAISAASIPDPSRVGRSKKSRSESLDSLSNLPSLHDDDSIGVATSAAATNGGRSSVVPVTPGGWSAASTPAPYLFSCTHEERQQSSSLNKRRSTLESILKAKRSSLREVSSTNPGKSKQQPSLESRPSQLADLALTKASAKAPSSSPSLTQSKSKLNLQQSEHEHGGVSAIPQAPSSPGALSLGIELQSSKKDRVAPSRNRSACSSLHPSEDSKQRRSRGRSTDALCEAIKERISRVLGNGPRRHHSSKTRDVSSPLILPSLSPSPSISVEKRTAHQWQTALDIVKIKQCGAFAIIVSSL